MPKQIPNVAPRKLNMLLGGECVSAKPVEIKSPHSGETVSLVDFAESKHIEQATEHAKQATSVMEQLSVSERVDILERMVAGLKARHEELALAIEQEAAKPRMLAKLEALRAADTFQNALEECKRLADGQGVGVDSVASGKGRYGIIRRFPVGPVLAISPFNFPLNLSAHKLAPAIAAGCPVVLKPASQTPSPALLLGQIALDAGLPAQALSVLPAFRSQADALIESEAFRLLTFTGSAEVGWNLKNRANKKKVVLELGGNAAVIIGQDADLDIAASRTAKGAFAYAGQVCISVQRAMVHQSVMHAFTEKLLKETTAKIVPKAPDDASTLLSSMIDKANAARITDWIQEATDKGAKILCGNQREGNAVWPTVLANVDPQARVSCEEAFGPIVTIASFESWEQGIAMANDSQFGLQAGVFTQDIRNIWKCFSTLQVGGVIHNDVPTFRVDMMPYGGVKNSGFGREGPRWSVAEMTEERLLVLSPQ